MSDDIKLEDKISKIEEKWQRKWKECKLFSVNSDAKGEKYYALDMYPYPSGNMHMGHVRNYSLGDANARFKRMRGFNVLYPMGFDSFGLPAENAAIKRNKRPREWTEKNIQSLKKQMQRLGFSFDWSRQIKSHDENYYRWNQWIFLKFFEEGLIYKDESEVNWCPKCKTVLANEQVIDGECERCDSEIIKKKKDQWFYKITEYSEELLEDLERLKWPDKVKKMQRDWIGRSEGIEISFDVVDYDYSLKAFTTRPDTIYGCTFMVLAPEHPLSEKIAKENEEVKKYIDKIKKIPEKERTGKTGIDTGLKAVNPMSGEKIPVYISEFVLMEYGTGAIMAVPAHDQRDFEFAKEHGLEIRKVVKKDDKQDELEEAYTGQGELVNSDKFNGYSSEEASKKITEELVENGIGKEKTNYRLKDWSISRQRYWGTPIPIIYCESCGTVPVPEEQLPVKLPDDDIEIDVEGSPLEHVEGFVNTQCPECGSDAKRETETLDTFADSSWYFLRFCSPDFEEAPFDKEKASEWMPVDQYTGGIEHAVLHLLYARFFTKVLHDLDLAPVREPFKKLLNQGMVLLNGKKMSKSKGNIVSPKKVVEEYGADVGRLFILSKSSPVKDLNWTEEGVQSTHDLLKSLYGFFKENKELITEKRDLKGGNLNDRYFLSKLQRNIKKVTEHMQDMEYHYAVSELEKVLSNGYKYVNEIDNADLKEQVFTEYIEKLALMFSPFVPHICEEIWHEMGHEGFVSVAQWPKANENLIDAKAESAKSLIDNIKSDVREIKQITGIENPEKIEVIVSAPWKYKLYSEVKSGAELSDIMKKEKFKKHGDQAVSYYQELNKLHQLDELKMSQEEELEAIKKLRNEIVNEFNADVIINKEIESESDKSGKSRPYKPAIVLE